MAIPHFVLTNSSSALVADTLKSKPHAHKVSGGARTVSIQTGKPVKSVRKAKGLGKHASGCAWYEAEDRTLPSVSSF